MRKEDVPEETAAADARSDGRPKSRGPRKPVVETDQDENIGEDSLLGESTLAKLIVSRKVDDAPAANDTPVAKVEDVSAVSDAPVVKAEDDSAEAAANAE